MQVSSAPLNEKKTPSQPVVVVFDRKEGHGYQLRSSLNIPLLAGIFASAADRDAAVHALESVDESSICVDACDDAWAVVVRQGDREIGRSPLMSNRAFAVATSRLTVLQAKKARFLLS